MSSRPAPPRTKLCRSCGQVKPVTDFHRNKANADGYRYPCKVCAGAYQQANRANVRARMARRALAEMEADFRLHAFYVFYRQTYAAEKSNDDRFGKALVASIAPIKDRAAMLAWHRSPGRKKEAVA